MPGDSDLRKELGVILERLITLERLLNNTIDHTKKINHSYPTVARDYNQILNRLRDLTKNNPVLKMIGDSLNNFEEKRFLPSENYAYAMDLQNVIRILCSNIRGLGLVEGEKISTHAAIPIVFVSYATEEIALAYFIEKILKRWTNNKIEVFIAKRDLKSSDAWVRIMEGMLKTAYCIIPICSKIAKNNPWVWWESAAVWGANHKVHPLFTNIYPEEFGQPLTLFVQGKSCFNQEEFISTLSTICQQLNVDVKSPELNKEELAEFDMLSAEHTKVVIPEPVPTENPAEVEISYDKISMTQELHEYSLVLDVVNRSKRKFDDVALKLYFPSGYLMQTKWDYLHLQSSIPVDRPGYLCLTFDYSVLPEPAKKQFSKYLLPGERLRIFGENGISKLRYQMDHERHAVRLKYKVQWELYVNGAAVGKGDISLDSIQLF